MPKTKCPECGWRGDVEEEHIGELTDCPECGGEFTIRRLKKKKKTLSTGATADRPVASSARTPAGAAAKIPVSKPASRLQVIGFGCLTTFIIPVLVAIPFIIYQSAKEDDEKAAIIQEVAAEHNAGPLANAYLALATDLSTILYWESMTTNLSGKKSGYHDEELFRKKLRAEMAKHVKDLGDEIDHAKIYRGVWVVHRRQEDVTSYVAYRFKDDGTATYVHYSDIYLTTELGRGSKNVSINGNVVKWTDNGTIDMDKIAKFSRDVMIFDELDGTYSIWHHENR